MGRKNAHEANFKPVSLRHAEVDKMPRRLDQRAAECSPRRTGQRGLHGRIRCGRAEARCAKTNSCAQLMPRREYLASRKSPDASTLCGKADVCDISSECIDGGMY